MEYNQPATCLSFNPVRPSLLACGYGDGMLNIINVENTKTPEIYEPGSEPAKARKKIHFVAAPSINLLFILSQEVISLVWL